MKVETTTQGLRAAIKIARKSGKSISLVPTMGNLHAGHIKLVKEAKARSEFVVVSIFVNPTQFGAGEDLDNYPRTLNEDYDKLEKAAANLVFVPSVEEVYPNYPQATTVTVGAVANQLCGASRAGHFDGVATVVTKLFNLVRPDIACFGEKDYQQLAVIRQITAELNFDIGIVPVPTQRADDGLALSSRNGYLTDDERKRAVALSSCLKRIGEHLQKGTKSYAGLIKAGEDYLAKHGFVVDYIAIKNPDLTDADESSSAWVVLAAAKLGSTRLIDNMTFNLADST